MRRLNSFGFVQLGKSLVPLNDLQQGKSTFGEVYFSLVEARQQLQYLLSREIFQLHTARPAAERLIAAITNLVPADLTAGLDAIRDEAKSSAILDWIYVYNIKVEVVKFEAVLADELSLLSTYVVAQKGIYSTGDLIANAENMVPASDLEKLPTITKDDLREAGRCLAFEVPTAAVFHLMRALESVILVYYVKVIGGPPKARMRNWGVYIKALRDSGKASDKIVHLLDHIRETYRNPVNHPEEIVTLDEAQRLFGVACSSMSQIAREL